MNYLAGFCPDGPNCIFGHPKWADDEKQTFLKKKTDQSTNEIVIDGVNNQVIEKI